MMMAEDEYTSRSTRTSFQTEEVYRPLAIRFAKEDGSEVEYNLGCGLSLRDLVLVLGCYTVFYSFLLGFSGILLKGAIDTSESGTLLWVFFVMGSTFGILVGTAVKIGTKHQDDLKKAQLQAESEKFLRDAQESVLP